MIYQEKYEQLMTAARQIVGRKGALAKPKVEEHLLPRVGAETPNDELLAHIISESLMRRIDRQLVESKNIYVEQFEIPQIAMFYSAAEAIPFIPAAHSLSNHYLVHAIGNATSATVLDIGIGKGMQMVSLIEMLRERAPNLKHLTVIGIDPLQHNTETARAAIEQAGEEHRISIDYHSRCSVIEQFDEPDFAKIAELVRGPLVVNSAFSFHHVAHPFGDHERRTRLLHRLVQLEPTVLVLAEPHSDHDTDNLVKRLHNSWDHFGHVYKLIDESSIEPSHKFAVKETFFGREVRDIFGVSDHFRSERHEPYQSWLLRLTKAGLSPCSREDLEVSLPSYCDVDISEGLVRMSYDGTTIVAVMAYNRG